MSFQYCTFILLTKEISFFFNFYAFVTRILKRPKIKDGKLIIGAPHHKTCASIFFTFKKKYSGKLLSILIKNRMTENDGVFRIIYFTTFSSNFFLSNFYLYFAVRRMIWEKKCLQVSAFSGKYNSTNQFLLC